MKISEKTMEYLVDTAMLGMDEEEKEAQRKDLERISTFTEKLGDLDTTGQDCVSHPFVPSLNSNRFRSDIVTNENKSKELIAAAPDSKGPYIRTPRTVED